MPHLISLLLLQLNWFQENMFENQPWLFFWLPNSFFRADPWVIAPQQFSQGMSQWASHKCRFMFCFVVAAELVSKVILDDQFWPSSWLSNSLFPSRSGDNHALGISWKYVNTTMYNHCSEMPVCFSFLWLQLNWFQNMSECHSQCIWFWNISEHSKCSWIAYRNPYFVGFWGLLTVRQRWPPLTL